MTALTLREQITAAIAEGLAEPGHDRTRVEAGADTTWIWVDGFPEPIQVKTDDVIVPPEFGDIAAGIRLDVQAILADRA